MENLEIKKEQNLKYVSLSEASHISGISRDYLNVLIRRGKLRAIKIGKNWLTTKDWISALKVSREEFKNENSQYLSLFNAARLAGVSAGYLNVAVRRGKLRAVKLGRNWFTTNEWLSEYQRSVGKTFEIISELKKIEEFSKIKKAEQTELASLREIFQTFKDREVSKKAASFIASQEIELPARQLGSDEKSKILEAVEERFKSTDVSEFQKVSKQLGILKSLKSWSHFKFSLASGLVVILLVVSLGMASGLINFPSSQFQALSSKFQTQASKFQASIFSDVFKNFSSDLPSFSEWLASGLNKSISLFKSKSPSELAVETFKTGSPKITKPQETLPTINTLAEAEVLDSVTEEEVLPSFVKTTEDQQGKIATGGNFTLLENRLAIVEADLKDQTDFFNSELSLQKKTILGTLVALFGIAKLVPTHPISTIVVQGQPATLTTYSVSPSVHSGFDRLSANYFNLANNAEINGSLTVKSGGTFNTLSVSGGTSLTGNTTIGGTLSVSGDTTLNNLTVNGSVTLAGGSFSNASTTYFTVSDTGWINKLRVTGTATTTFNNPITSASGNFIVAGDSASNVLLNPYGGSVGIGTTSPGSLLSIHSSGNVYIGGDLTVSGITNLSGNSFSSVNASTTNLTVAGTAWISKGVITNASTTYATLPTFWGTTGTVTNLTATNASTSALTINFSTAQSTSTTPFNVYTSTSSVFSIAPSGLVTAADFTATKSTLTSASSTNLTATNFWSTNGTITNASTTYLTVTNNAWFNNVLTSGSLNVGTTATTSNGALETSGNVRINGNLYVAGNTNLGDIAVTNASSTNLTATNLFVYGTASTSNLLVSGNVVSNLIPSQNSVYDLGSTSFYWKNAYVGTLTVNNISAASTSIGGTQSETFTINSDNTGADGENSSLVFFRGAVVPNALLTWNAATSSKRFEFNQVLYINNESASTTNPTLTVKTIANQTANGLQVIDNNSSNIFSVNPVGNNTTMINASTSALTINFSTAKSTSTTPFNVYTSTSSVFSIAPSGLVTAADFTATKSTLTSASSTNLTATNFWSTTGTITTLNSTNGTITNASTTYATIPTFWGTTGTVTNLTATNASTSALTINFSTAQSTSTTPFNVYSSTSSVFSIAPSGLVTANNFTATTATLTSASSTNLTATNFWSTKGTITNASTTNLTATNLWLTNSYITTASSTNASSTYLTVSDTAWINKLNITNTNSTSTITGGLTVGNNAALVVNSGSSANSLYIAGNGNVGIGTTTPGSLFSVHSTGNTYLGGDLTVSGQTNLVNASTSILTAPTLFSTNGTITNASSTNLTGTNFWSTTGTITTLNSTTGTITNASTSALTINFSASQSTSTTPFNVYSSTSSVFSIAPSGLVTAADFTATKSTLTSASSTNLDRKSVV